MANQKEIAVHLDLSDRRIRGLVQDGVIPAGKGPGGYDIDACRVSYIRYLRGVQSGQVKTAKEHSDEDDTSYSALLEMEKYREKKRENDMAEGLVSPNSILTEALYSLGAQIVPILESLPLEAKRMNPKLTGKDIQLMKKAIARCRNAIADIKLKK